MITNEIKRQIFEEFGNVNVKWEDRFDGFPHGSCVDHSWAGLMGWTERITPILSNDKGLVFGARWNNTIWEISNNGRDGGTDDARKGTKDLPSDHLLLGYHREGEYHEQNASHDPEYEIVLFRNVSTCEELSREIHENAFKLWCEKLETGFYQPESKVVELP